MKINFKYITLLLAFLGLVACDKEELVAPDAPVKEYPALNANGLDFSKYVSVGASFTAGFSDGALFKAAQESSFPALLATQFAKSGGGNFTQPLMSDNIGGIVAGGNAIQAPRLFFNGKAPERLEATPTTTLANLGSAFNNMGVPGAKSFHMVANGYGNPQGVAVGLANPYYARFASSATSSMLGDALAQQPTFFTLSEVGGNDVLVYATAGGVGKDQTGNLDPSTYGSADITDPNVFANVFSNMVTALTSGGAKGVIATVPYITDLPHFTTVPHNPLAPSNEAYAATIPMLNTVYGALNQVYQAIGQTNRMVVFSSDAPSPVVIKDENLTDISATITGALNANPDFPAFVTQFGLPAQAAPLVATLLGNTYGQTRAATAEDLLVLPSSSVIGTVNEDVMAYLMSQGLPAATAGQFAVEGITLPLADKWVLTPQEKALVKDAVDAYNSTIKAVAYSNDNVVLVDLNAILTQASTAGVQFGNYTMNTNLVTGGLVSLDGVHLTTRGYGLMAYKFLEQMDKPVKGTDEDPNDKGFGTNFLKANAVPMAGNLPTNYSKDFR